jgi:hypothetical protein
MAKYAYEYGKRWLVEVPRNDIRWLMGRVHVATPDAQVADDIRMRCIGPGYSAAVIRQSIAYALECHKRNRALYAFVTGSI